jgi:hypothetical protein
VSTSSPTPTIPADGADGGEGRKRSPSSTAAKAATTRGWIAPGCRGDARREAVGRDEQQRLEDPEVEAAEDRGAPPPGPRTAVAATRVSSRSPPASPGSRRRASVGRPAGAGGDHVGGAPQGRGERRQESGAEHGASRSTAGSERSLRSTLRSDWITDRSTPCRELGPLRRTSCCSRSTRRHPEGRAGAARAAPGDRRRRAPARHPAAVEPGARGRPRRVPRRGRRELRAAGRRGLADRPAGIRHGRGRPPVQRDRPTPRPAADAVGRGAGPAPARPDVTVLPPQRGGSPRPAPCWPTSPTTT